VTRWIVWLPLAALAALAILFATFGLHHDPHVNPAALVGKPVPAETLPPLSGGPPQPLRAELQGATLVNFFASWCVPCAEEHPALMALKAEGARIVGVAYKDDPAASRTFLERQGDPFAAVLMDREGRAGIDFGVSGVPETFLVGADGVILAKHTGPLEPADAEAMLEQAQGASTRPAR